MTHILIVEDEPKLAQLIVHYLSRESYDYHHIADGLEVMPWLADHKTDLILLDLNLPGRDGLSLCREIRAQANTPIIMTTARVDELDRLLGLELGADDYLCKPYSPRELVARIKAVLRRSQQVGVSIATKGLELNEDQLTIKINGHAVALTPVEFALLKRMAEQPGRIYSRDQLMDSIYPDHRVVNDRTIDSHIKKLRRKLEGADTSHEWIQSVYGAGYRVNLPDDV
jgi:two-component system response regulator BaeR